MSNRRRPGKLDVLDVKVRATGPAGAATRRGAVVMLVVALAAGTLFGVYRLGQWGLRRWVLEGPRFRVTEVAVESDGALDPQMVRRFAGVRVGQGLWTVDLDQAQRNLELLPLVARAEVRRVWPDKLVIRIEERVPVAQVQAAGRAVDGEFLIDRNGVVMKPLRLTDGTVVRPQAPGTLPVLTGLAVRDLQVGRKVETEQVYRALTLLNLLEQSAAGVMMDAARVDLSNPRHLVLTTSQRTAVRFDTEDFARQLRRLGVIMNWARQRGKAVQTVDLTVARGVPVTFTN